MPSYLTNLSLLIALTGIERESLIDWKSVSLKLTFISLFSTIFFLLKAFGNFLSNNLMT